MVEGAMLLFPTGDHVEELDIVDYGPKRRAIQEQRLKMKESDIQISNRRLPPRQDQCKVTQNPPEIWQDIMTL